MTVHLLDAKALIALVIQEHEHHDRVRDWMAAVDRIALCPVVEGALVRFLVRLGERAESAQAVLQGLHATSRCELWADSLSYTDVAVAHVHGHRQVTDAYLASLAVAGGGRLATLDEGLARALPDAVELIPRVD